MARSFKDTVRSSMGLKFVLVLSGWILLLMLVGSVFVARMLLDSQQHALEARGKEMGKVIAKASLDRLVANDVLGLNLIVEDILNSSDMLAIVVTSADGTPLTSVRSSFNRALPEVKAVIDRVKTDSTAAIASAMTRDLKPIEVAVPVFIDRTKIGEVRLDFSRREVRGGAIRVVLLLIGTSIIIVLSIAALQFVMVRRMIILPTRAAETMANQIAAGNLEQHVRVSTIDEIGDLGRGLNRMIIGLKEIVQSVRGAALKMEHVSSDVIGVSANVAAASKVQAESVEEAASSVNEMHFSLREIAESVEDLSASSEQTSSAVIETAASIDEVARTMNDLSTSIDETSSAITQMSATIGTVAENVSVLTGVVDETSSAAEEVTASVREV